MPSFANMSMLAAAGGGAIAGATMGWNRSANDPRVRDSEDRMHYTMSSTVLGGSIGAGLGGVSLMSKAIGFKGMSTLTGTGASSMSYLATKGASLATSAGRSAMGAGKAIWNLPTPFKAAGLIGLGAAIAGRSLIHRDDRPADAYATPDGAGGISYDPVKQRMNALNASGDMVFGMHNLRHG